MNKASVSATEYATKIKAGTGSAQSYATAQRATNTALQEVSIGASIASKAVKLLSVTFNMIAFTAFINGVSRLIGKVDEWIVTADEAKESADAFKESLSSFFDETQSNLKTITSLSDRFDELSKNVDANGKQIGGTTEEYDEFLGICEQVGQIMPELITGYTNEGQAIITLRGEVDSLTESYDNAIRAKAALFLSNGDDEGNTIDSFFDDYNNFVQGDQGFLGLKTSPSGQNTAEEFEQYYGYDKVHGWLSDVTDATLEDLQNLRAGTTEYVYLARVLKEAGYEISEISADNYNAIHDVFNSRMTVMEQGITDRVTNIKNAFQNMLYADGEYWEIDDEKVISAINSVYASIDDEFIKQNNLFNQTALQTFESDLVSLFTNDTTKQAMLNFYSPISDEETVQEYTDRVKTALETIQSYCNTNGIIIPISLNEETEALQKQYDDAINRFTETETQTLDDLKAKYQEAIDKRNELYSGSNYVGNVDVNNRPVVINDDGTYSTTSTSFQERQLDDGSYEIIHFTPILPDGTILEGDALNNYLDKILSSSDVLNADNPTNGGYGLVYKVDTEVNGQKITDGNLDDAFGVADAWDVEMHNLQDKMYRDEAEIKSAIEEFGTGSNVDLEKFFTDNSINTTEEIDYWNKVTDGAKSASEAVEMYNKVKSETFVTNTISLDDLNNQIDSIQSAYKGLTTACEEYNQYGYIMADTLQTLLSMDSQYLACLINENGQLQINGQTYQALVQAKLADAEATAVQQAIEELGTVTTEQQISADTTAIGVMAQKGTALATLTGQYAALANVAVSAAQAQALADAYTDASSKNKEEADRVMSNLNAKLALIQNTAKNTSGSFGALTNHLNGFSNASGKASKSTDALTESMKKQKEALESTKSELEKQKQYYEDVAEAIDWFYDKQIEKQEKAIDSLEKENELLEERIDYYDGALSAIDRYYEKQIEKLEEQKDALAGNNKEEEIALNLEKRRQELAEAKTRKNILQYESGKGFSYTTDTSAIKTAEENLADAQRQKEEADIDAKIDKLKEYQALWAEIPSAKQKAEEESQMIEMLGANWESILLEGRIQNITSFKDQYIGLQQQIDNNESMIASYEEKIAYYESLKTEWDNLLAKYTEDTYTQLLIGAFGNDFENELLNGRTDRWTKFAEDYYNIQVQLKDVTDQIESLAKRMEEYASRIESAANSAVKAVNDLANVKIPSIPSVNKSSGSSSSNSISGNKYISSVKAKGGIITKEDRGDLDFVAKSLGEDHMVALTEGEAVIPKENVAKNPEAIDSLLSGQKLDLKSLVNRDIVLQRATPLDTYSMLEKYKDWVIPDSLIMSRLNLPSQDFSKLGVVNNNQQQTVIQINGDLSFPNIKSGNDAELLLNDLSNMANKARQRSARR